MDQQPAQPQRIRSVTPPRCSNSSRNRNRNSHNSEPAARAPAPVAPAPPPAAENHHHLEDEDDKNSIEDDLAFILHRYGGVFPVVPRLSLPPSPPPPPPPPPSTNAVVPPGAHAYHPTRQPRRSSLKPATTTTRTTTRPHRGVPRVRATEVPPATTTRRAPPPFPTAVRGVRPPVPRRRSTIGFAAQVERYDIPSRTSFTAGECRAVWLQDDEVRAMNVHRKALIRKQQARHAAAAQQHQQLQHQQQQHQQQPPAWKAITTTTTSTTKTKFKTVAQQLFRTTTGNSGAQRRSLSPLHRLARNNSASTKPGRRFSWTKPRTFRKVGAPLSNAQHNTHDTTDTTNNTPTNTMLKAGSGSYSGSFSGSVSGSSTTSDTDSFRGLEKYLDRSGRKQKTMVCTENNRNQTHSSSSSLYIFVVYC